MKRLAEIRKNNNLLQKDIAMYIGVDRTTYNKYEKGLSEPSIDTIKKLASYFRVSIDYLLDFTAVEQKNTKDSLSEKEKEILNKYRNLSAEGQFEVDKYIDYAQERYKKDHPVSNVADK